MIDTTKSIEACANYYGPDSEEMKKLVKTLLITTLMISAFN